MRMQIQSLAACNGTDGILMLSRENFSRACARFRMNTNGVFIVIPRDRGERERERAHEMDYERLCALCMKIVNGRGAVSASIQAKKPSALDISPFSAIAALQEVGNSSVRKKSCYM